MPREPRQKLTARDYLRDEVRLIPTPAEVGLRVGLCYPNSYETGMCNLGFHFVYRQLCGRPDTTVERLFHAPGVAPVSLENGRSLTDFSVLAFSVTWEMDFFHLAEMLVRGNVAPFRRERSDADPLVIMGGTCAGQNPFPLAEMVDCFLLGDGEEGADAIWDALLDAGWPGGSRSKALDALAELPGCYVPAVHGLEDNIAIPRLTVGDLTPHDACSAIITPHTQFGNMWLVETTRGCAGGCKFCLVGFTQPRERHHSAERIMGMVREHDDVIERIGFMGSSVCGHPQLMDMVDAAVEMGKTVSISSMRADQLTPELLETLARGGMKTMTLAPESGDDLSRLQLNKTIKDQHFIDLAKVAGEVGIEVIKLYALVRTPESPDNEMDSIANLASEVRKAFLASKSPGPKTVTVGAAPFVPKPHTPFAGAEMARENVIAKDLKRLRSLCAKNKLKLTSHSAFEALVQGALSLSGPSAGEVIVAAAMDKENWRRILRDALGNALTDPRELSDDRHTMPLRRNHAQRVAKAAPRQRKQPQLAG